MKRLLSSVLLCVLLATGCTLAPKHISDLPPGVSETQVRDWYASTAALKDIAQLVGAGTSATISLHNQGAFPAGESTYQSVLAIFAKIDQAGIHAGNTLKIAPQNFNAGVRQQLRTDVQTITDELAKASTDKTLANNTATQTTLASLRLAVAALQVASGF